MSQAHQLLQQSPQLILDTHNKIGISRIRNFTIIAHIDHGKTTLVDKMLELVGRKRLDQERVTDTLTIEQKKGITVKMQPITFLYKNYVLNIIDTPGHIDFTYEVSRSLKAVEGAILLVDVTKGIQAQTIDNLLKALMQNLVIIPVLSKVDMADETLIQQRLKEMNAILDINPDDVILTSGHTGQGIQQLLDTIINKIPSPGYGNQRILKDVSLNNSNQPYALVFDLKYNNHLGMIATIRMFNGEIRKEQPLLLVNENQKFISKQVGIYTPNLTETKVLKAGDIGYIATGIKQTNQIFIGETISNLQTITITGYKRPKPLVFASIYPKDPSEYTTFKDAIERLALNDSGLQIKEIKSSLLGRGFRLGCLGTLHLEIVKERLTQEFDLNPILTMPTVNYKIKLVNQNKYLNVHTPNQFPDNTSLVQDVKEPILAGDIITPQEYLSSISNTVKAYRGVIKEITQYQKQGININYYNLLITIPLSALVDGFFNAILKASKGFASFSYTNIKYESAKIIKVQILVNKEEYPELSFLSHPDTARSKALKILHALKATIPPSIVHIPLQAAIGGTIIARETIRAYRKNVTAKLYGGDVRRKLKLLHKQAKLKNIRKQYIKIKIPPEAFIKAIKSLSNTT